MDFTTDWVRFQWASQSWFWKWWCRWILRLIECDFNELLNPGSENGDADGFSSSSFLDFLHLRRSKKIFKLLRFLTICRKLRKQSWRNKLRTTDLLAMLNWSRPEKNGYYNAIRKTVFTKQYHDRAHQTASTVVRTLKLRRYCQRWEKKSLKLFYNVCALEERIESLRRQRWSFQLFLGNPSHMWRWMWLQNNQWHLMDFYGS
jgi:hypothetical protein